MSAGRTTNPSNLILGTALLAALIAYAPSLPFGYLALQDGAHLFQNLRVSYGLSPEGWPQVFDTTPAWQPTVWLSHLLDMTMFGPSAGPRRLENLLIHLANMILLFVVLRRWTGQEVPAAIAAALFGLHPLRSEAIVWVSQRSVLLVTLFLLLAIWLAQRGNRIPAAFSAVLSLLAIPISQPDNATAWLAGAWFHVRESFWPANLAIDGHPTGSIEAMLGAGVIAVLVLAGLLMQYRGNTVAAWSFWWTAAACLVFFCAPARAGRWTYVAHLGLWTALVWTVREFLPGQASNFAKLAVALMLVFAGAAWVRNSDFRDTFTLLRQTRDAAGLSQPLQLSLAQLLFEAGRYTESELEFRRYTVMAPNSGDGWAGLGNTLLSQKRQPDAAAAFREGTRRDPNLPSNYYGLGLAELNQGHRAEATAALTKALDLKLEGGAAAVACNNLGSILAQDKRFPEAQAWFEKAIEYDIRFVAAHRNLALVLNDQGRRLAAIAHLEKKGLLWTNNDEILGRLRVDLLNMQSIEEQRRMLQERERQKKKQQ